MMAMMTIYDMNDAIASNRMLGALRKLDLCKDELYYKQKRNIGVILMGFARYRL